MRALVAAPLTGANGLGDVDPSTGQIHGKVSLTEGHLMAILCV
jgi:hypothetical protein